MKLIAESRGVRGVMFYTKKRLYRNALALYDAESFKITLKVPPKRLTKRVICAFMHELGHHEAVSNQLWMNYHLRNLDDEGNPITPEKAFDIENQIDRIASKLWSLYVDKNAWGRYVFSYPRVHKNQYLRALENFLTGKHET